METFSRACSTIFERRGLKTPPHTQAQTRMIARTDAKSVGGVRKPTRVGLR
jgi:hypothetical protein